MSEVFPNYNSNDNDVLRQEVESRAVKNTLPPLVRDYLFDTLSSFQYELGKYGDLRDSILGIDEANLSDCPSWHAFFGLCAAKARQREKQVIEKLKELEAGSVTSGSKKTVTQQKGEARLTQNYKGFQTILLHVSRIRKDCEVMKDTVKMKLDSTRTQSADARVAMQPGVWNETKQP